MQYPRRSPARSYLSDDTIVAPVSGPGGAIAVLRVSGPGAPSILRGLTGTDRYKERELTLARLVDARGALIDESMVVSFVAPRSFTGEEVFEVHSHGGSFVPRRILDRILELGARVALPGEFSFRAVRSGKMTIGQAQAVADLIASENATASALALERMDGLQDRRVHELGERLRDLVSLSELGIDFSDQDVPEVSSDGLRPKLRTVILELEALSASFERGRRIQNGVTVALVGLPNAGKSSFFNALVGEDRALVSDVPGTTRDGIRECVTLLGSRGSVTLRLEDTAGLRETGDQVEAAGIERTRRAARRADLRVAVVDPEQPLEAFVREWESVAPSDGAAAVGVLTKSDLSRVEDSTVDDLKARTGISTWCRVSSVTGTGVADAAAALARACDAWVGREAGELVLTHAQQRDAVEESLTHLRRAWATQAQDLYASDLRQALHALSPLIGETLTDDLLGRIFGRFCIGK